MEKHFKVLLIDRSQKQFQLTREGYQVYESAKEILHTYDKLDSDLQELKKVISGTIRISTIYSIGLHELPPYADGTRFVVDEGGTEVWAWWPEGATLDATATYLLGPVFGWLLRLRGVLALHASVAALDGRAAAFAGPAGMGKSTTAAGSPLSRRIEIEQVSTVTNSHLLPGSPEASRAAVARPLTPPAQPRPNTGTRRTSSRRPSRGATLASRLGVAMPVTNRHIVMLSGSARNAMSICRFDTGNHENNVSTCARSRCGNRSGPRRASPFRWRPPARERPTSSSCPSFAASNCATRTTVTTAST